RITSIWQLSRLRSEFERSAGPNVAQVSLYRRLPACRTGACLEISEILNGPHCPIQSDRNTGNGSGALQVKNLRYSPADARRRGTLRLRAKQQRAFEIRIPSDFGVRISGLNR